VKTKSSVTKPTSKTAMLSLGIGREGFLAGPAVHVFGHIHGGSGTFSDGFTTFVNASLMGPYGALDKRPLLFGFKGD
jgi:hypothetical protein